MLISGYESCFYWEQVGCKQSNASWVTKGESSRTAVRQGQFGNKTLICIFFRRSGVEQITYLDKGVTNDHQSYFNDCLKPLVKVINKQRSHMGAKIWNFTKMPFDYMFIKTS